jgi:hypothetical protein
MFIQFVFIGHLLFTESKLYLSTSAHFFAFGNGDVALMVAPVVMLQARCTSHGSGGIKAGCKQGAFTTGIFELRIQSDSCVFAALNNHISYLHSTLKLMLLKIGFRLMLTHSLCMYFES